MRSPKRMIFLDRDGVINKNPIYGDYIKRPGEFKFIPGARRGVKMLSDAGFDIAIISNQTGVGKGLFTKSDLRRVDAKMRRGLKASGARIKGSYYCIHNPALNCACRKPRPGLIEKAVGRRKIDVKGSFFIGDTERDMLAGRGFGLAAIAVLSGYAARRDMRSWKARPDFIARDLLSAAKAIILKTQGALR